ncbi:MAG TPA: DNA polymerase IV, partial [Pseudonocardiaceae bacterium]
MGRSGDLPRGLVERYLADESAPASWPDDAGCPILHVDMDAFYASVEIRDRPELWERPVVVGGIGPRGVVCSANYLARRYGVRSAMPTSRARRLCPQAAFLPPNFPVYREVSAGVMAIFRELTPLVEPLSLDEAFLDVAGALRRTKGTPARLGMEIRRSVEATHRISCSVGVASTKFIAKLASGMAKPDGLLVVPKTQTLAFLRPLPVSALWGVGARTAEALTRVGLTTVGDVADSPLPRLRRVIGVAAAEHLHALANGHDDRGVVPES